MTYLIYRILFILTALAAGGFLLYETVFAATSPDNLAINDAQCFGGLLETGDILCVTSYKVEYEINPSDPIEQTFLNTLTSSTTDSGIRSATPRQYVNSGYGNGVVSVYLSDASADSLGVIWNAAHRSEIEGNPSAFGGTIPSISNSYTWIAQSSSEDELEEFLIEVALDLESESEWADTDLIDNSSGETFFTTDGAAYFATAIPNLRLMTPGLFEIGVSSPSFEEKTFSNDYQAALDAQWNAGPFSDTFSNVAVDVPAPESTWKMLFAFAGSIGFWALGAVTLARYRVPNGPIYALVLGMMAFFTFATIGLVDIRFVAALLFLCVIGGALWIAKTFTTDTLNFFWMFAIIVYVFGNLTSGMFDVTTSSTTLGSAELTVPINDTNGSFTVNDNSSLQDCAGKFLYIENEILECVSTASTFQISASRGANGTTAVAHPAGARIYAETSGALNELADFQLFEIKTIAGVIPYPSIDIGFLRDVFIAAFAWDYSWMNGGFGIFRVFGIAIGFVALLLTFVELGRMVLGAIR